MTECTHENKIFPVSDSNGWAVGLLCDCGFFQIRKDMPDYETRQKASVVFRQQAKEIKESGGKTMSKTELETWFLNLSMSDKLSLYEGRKQLGVD